MPAVPPRRRAADLTTAVVGIALLGGTSLLPWWQQWVELAGPTDVTRWSAWQASDLASAALVLAGLALALGAWLPRGAAARARYAPAAVAWSAVLLLAVQASRLGPPPAGGEVAATLTDVQGIPGAQVLRAAQGSGRPDLHVVGEGAIRADLGVGAFLGALAVLAVAVILTGRARRPMVERAGPAESGGPAAG